MQGEEVFKNLDECQFVVYKEYTNRRVVCLKGELPL